MACIAKRRGRYIIDFYDTYGKRRWVTMPKGTTKKKAKEKYREVEDQLSGAFICPIRRFLFLIRLLRIGLNTKSRTSDIQHGPGMKGIPETILMILTQSRLIE